MIRSGSLQSDILLLGEAPGQKELETGLPMAGYSGQLLVQSLRTVGFNQSQMFTTNVTSYQPPAGLYGSANIDAFFHGKQEAKAIGIKEVLGRYPKYQITEGLADLDKVLQELKPRITIAVGGTALWAATGLEGIDKWRGSILEARWGGLVVPTLHPANVLRDMDRRYILETDLRKAKALYEGKLPRPLYRFTLRPTLDQVMAFINSIKPGDTVVQDIETRLNQISCLGFATSAEDAICIPLMSETGSYWSASEEATIIHSLSTALRQPGVTSVFHNAGFDCQYYAAQLGFLPSHVEDTMVMQAVCFPGEKKGLDFCASMYSGWYKYWKDDGKFWDPTKMPIEQHWHYNCEDLSYTYRIYVELKELLEKFGLTAQYEFERSLLKPVVKMMLRGVRYNSGRKSELYKEADAKMNTLLSEMATICGHPVNPRSTPQMKALFYTDFGCQKVLNRKTKQPSLDDDAMQTIRRKNPLLVPLIERISQYRSLSVFKNTFLAAKTSEDGRMRCSFNIVGTETFRFSSSQSIQGSGLNLQNIPKGTEK